MSDERKITSVRAMAEALGAVDRTPKANEPTESVIYLRAPAMPEPEPDDSDDAA